MNSAILGYQHFPDRQQYGHDCPEGMWTARLDHKAWGKLQNLVLYVTDVETGEKYWLLVFVQNGYRPRDYGHDFHHDAAPGDVFVFTTSRTKGAYANLESARRISTAAAL